MDTVENAKSTMHALEAEIRSRKRRHYGSEG